MDIKILNENLAILGKLRKYQFAQYDNKIREIGEFEIHLEMTEQNKYLLDEDREFYVLLNEKDFGKVIECKKEDEDDRNIIAVKGKMGNQFFANRIIYRTVKYKGNTARYIKFLIEDQITKDKSSPRYLNIKVVLKNETYLDMICSRIEKTVTGGYLWDEIQEVLEQDSLAMNFYPVYKPLHMSGGVETNISEWVVEISAGVDRTKQSRDKSKTVVLSQALSNISNSSYNISNEDYCDVAYIAGEGEGENRKWYELQNTDQKGLKATGRRGWQRKELWIDARDIQSEREDGTQMPNEQYDILIRERAKQKFLEHRKLESYETSIVPHQSYVLGKDYELGDFITIEDEQLNISMDAQIVGATFSETEDRQVTDINICYGTEKKIYDVNNQLDKLHEMMEEHQNNVKYLEDQINSKTNVKVEIIEGKGFVAKKYSNGVLELTQEVEIPMVFTQQIGSLFYGKFNLGKWAVPFVLKPQIKSVQNNSSFSFMYDSVSQDGTLLDKTNIGEHYFFRFSLTNQPNSKASIVITAIGRWH